MADNKIFQARILNKVDTDSNWTKNDPILKNGEIAISSDYTPYRFKIGTGKKWSETSWADANLDNKMNKANPTGTGSVAIGNIVTASGDNSVAMGTLATASSTASVALGSIVTASQTGAFAEGIGSKATAISAHAEGNYTVASGTNSHAEGTQTKASSTSQHAQGKYNIEDTAGTYAHIVGNGTNTARSNAHTLDWKGNGWFAGDVYVGGTSQTAGEKLAKQSELPSEATTSTAGLMSSADKSKLDGIAANANAYTHPSYTARTGKPAANVTPDFGGSFTASQITSDSQGHVSGMTDRTITIPATLSNGTGTAGLIKTTSAVTSASGYTPSPVIGGVPYYKDTTYSAATQSASGLLTAAGKKKIDLALTYSALPNYTAGTSTIGELKTALLAWAREHGNHPKATCYFSINNGLLANKWADDDTDTRAGIRYTVTMLNSYGEKNDHYTLLLSPYSGNNTLYIVSIESGVVKDTLTALITDHNIGTHSVASAAKLTTARTIGLSGAASGTATSFNGTSNISIPVTSLNESYLVWGADSGSSKSYNGYLSYAGATFSPITRSNLIAGLGASYFTFERSTDAGSTWTTYTPSNLGSYPLITYIGDDYTEINNGNTTTSQSVKNWHQKTVKFNHIKRYHCKQCPF